MRTAAIVPALLLLSICGITTAADFGETGYREDTMLIAPEDGACGEPFFSSDGTYENAYCWQNDGMVAPNYGAFAERYDAGISARVCSVVLDLTQIGEQAGQVMDVYVWMDTYGLPGAVVEVASVDPGPVAFWPLVSRHSFSMSACNGSKFWVGYWGSWPGEPCGWFIGADLDGSGGTPRTNIAPGIGYPTGWNDVSIVWGPTAALGISAEADICHHDDEWGACCYEDGSCEMTEPDKCAGDWFYDLDCDSNPCGTTPTVGTSWGSVKTLYR